MSSFNTINDIWNFLNTIPMFQKEGVSAANFSLDNISEFCSKLGNPQLDYPVIHVAGTNGKGTTCYLLEKIYEDAGYKTGVFTSPHLLRYNERVRVGGKEISDEELLVFFREVEELLEIIKLSYFEICTALVFWYFSQEKVELAIIEAGLGGRLDSTNIVEPEVAVITSIGLDHQNVLGNTLEEIAFEKAGIIKKNKPVVVGKIDNKALQVIENVAHAKNSRILSAGELDPGWEQGVIVFRSMQINMQSLFRESVNKWNVACAWQVCKTLSPQFTVSEKSFIRSINTFTGAPGRFEKLHSKFNWYFSGSHNLQSLDASLEAVKEIKKLEDAILIFSAMKDKINEEMLNRLKSFKKKYFVEQMGERAAKIGDVEGMFEVVLMDENNSQIILNELKTELVIFAGSFYFYPIIKRWISKV